MLLYRQINNWVALSPPKIISFSENCLQLRQSITTATVAQILTDAVYSTFDHQRHIPVSVFELLRLQIDYAEAIAVGKICILDAPLEYSLAELKPGRWYSIRLKGGLRVPTSFGKAHFAICRS